MGIGVHVERIRFNVQEIFNYLQRMWKLNQRNFMSFKNGGHGKLYWYDLFMTEEQ